MSIDRSLRHQDQQTIAALPVLATMLPLHRYSVTQLSWLVTRFPQELQATEQQDVTWFCAQDTTIASAYQVVQAFRQLLHERKEGQLLAWATTCEASGIPEIQRFLRHLRQQWDPAVAATTVQASNGQTDGQVHKLKLLKRLMYGRAGFALLRQQVLHAA